MKWRQREEVDSSPSVRWLSVLQNLADQLFYPLEHAAWAAEHGVVDGGVGDGNVWSDRANYCWAASLLLEVAKSAVAIANLRRYTEEGKLQEPDRYVHVRVCIPS